MKNRKNVISAAVYLICLFLFGLTVMADSGEFYTSQSGTYSFIMPEGYSYSTTLTSLNQEAYTGSGSANFNISENEDETISEALMILAADALLDSFAEQYTSLGVAEEDIEKEGIFTSEGNNRTWLGIKISFWGMTMHQCMTCGDTRYFIITFTDMDQEDEQKILNSFETWEGNNGSQSPAEEPSGSDSEGSFSDSQETSDAEGIVYTLLDGKMQVTIPSSYDVLVKDQTVITDELAEYYETTKDKLDLWLSLQGSDLIAFEKGGGMIGNSDEIHVRIKPDKYEGIDDFRKLPASIKRSTAENLISGFPDTNGYEFYETDAACFIVFNTTMLAEEIRYATIMHEAMIYLYYEPASGSLPAGADQIMQEIADMVRFM